MAEARSLCTGHVHDPPYQEAEWWWPPGTESCAGRLTWLPAAAPMHICRGTLASSVTCLSLGFLVYGGKPIPLASQAPVEVERRCSRTLTERADDL